MEWGHKTQSQGNNDSDAGKKNQYVDKKRWADTFFVCFRKSFYTEEYILPKLSQSVSRPVTVRVSKFLLRSSDSKVTNNNNQCLNISLVSKKVPINHQ